MTADQPVEHTARFLRIHLAFVNRPRMLDRLLNGDGRNLIEDDALDVRVGLVLERVVQVPGNRLALAVVIGSKQDIGAFFCVALQFLEQFCPPAHGNIFRLKMVVNIDSHAAFGQVDKMPHRCLDGVARTKIFFDRGRLCRGFHDDERLFFRFRLRFCLCHIIL